MMIGLNLAIPNIAATIDGGWSPLALGSKVIAWWDSSVGVSLSGSEVTAWADRKNGYTVSQATSASRPLWTATSFNGFPGLAFDGSNDELTGSGASLLAALPAGSSGSEIWSVAQQDALITDTATRTLVSYGEDSNTGRQIRRQVISSGTVHQLFALVGTGTGATAATNTPADATGRHLFRAEFNPDTVAFSLDGNRASVSAVPATTASRLRIGSLPNASPGTYWQGKVRDVIVTLPLSAAEAAQLQAFLLPRRAL